MAKRKPASGATASSSASPASQGGGLESKPHPKSLGRRIRELTDELIFVFVIVMFIKMFVVELYKIPTGSMTPTLFGGLVAYVDLNEDGEDDILYWDGELQYPPLVFMAGQQRYEAVGRIPFDPATVERWYDEGRIRKRNDKILVNKIAYWFDHPERGDIVVFKVPARIYDPASPIYIKRVVGEPNDVLSFANLETDEPDGTLKGRLVVNGTLAEKPDFFETQRYVPRVSTYGNQFFEVPGVEYAQVDPGGVQIQSIHVPEGQYYVFGDNADGSLDSRYWGPVPFENMKGRAFLKIGRFLPFPSLALLK